MTESRIFPVLGMMCAACSANVERKLRKTPGVVDVSVSLPGRTASVEYDPSVVTPEDLRREVAAAGYQLVIDGGAGVEDVQRRAFVDLRRRTLLSWVFAALVMLFSMGGLFRDRPFVGNLLCLLLAAACIVFCGRTFFVTALQQAKHRSANMDTLVALSTGISFLFSLWLTFSGSAHTWFDSVTMITSFVLTGRLLEEKAKKVGGHGGMDFIMDYRLVYCLQNGLPLDMDVYDMAEWCCLGELTRISLENGSAPVAIPDFTRGAWNRIQGFHYAFKNE